MRRDDTEMMREIKDYVGTDDQESLVETANYGGIGWTEKVVVASADTSQQRTRVGGCE